MGENMSEAIQRGLQWLEERRRSSDEETGLFEGLSAMTGPVRVVADSSCDLPSELLEQYGVITVPLIVRFGHEEFPETELSRTLFWQHAETVAPPHTSQPSLGSFEQAFAPLVSSGAIVLCLTITGQHSGTYNTALLAAQEYPQRVFVWDSQSISLGMGFQVLEAAAMAQQGQPLDKIVPQLLWMRRQSRFTILLETIEYLRRGGRLQRMIDALERLVSMLSIRPLLRLSEGELRPLGAVRSLRRGLARLRAEAEEAAPLFRLGIAHTRRPKEAQELANELAGKLGLAEEQILVGEVGAALASHAGPRALGVVTIGMPENTA